MRKPLPICLLQLGGFPGRTPAQGRCSLGVGVMAFQPGARISQKDLLALPHPCIGFSEESLNDAVS